MLMFIGLNPSTADETKNDPTVTRCINFAKDLGYTGMFMMNIFAFRSTDPIPMKREADPIGPDNDKHLMEVAGECMGIIGCWGNHGQHMNRGAAVARMFSSMCCFGVNSTGEPKHPLYLSRSTPIEVYDRHSKVHA